MLWGQGCEVLHAKLRALALSDPGGPEIMLGYEVLRTKSRTLALSDPG